MPEPSARDRIRQALAQSGTERLKKLRDRRDRDNQAIQPAWYQGADADGLAQFSKLGGDAIGGGILLTNAALEIGGAVMPRSTDGRFRGDQRVRNLEERETPFVPQIVIFLRVEIYDCTEAIAVPTPPAIASYEFVDISGYAEFTGSRKIPSYPINFELEANGIIISVEMESPTLVRINHSISPPTSVSPLRGTNGQGKPFWLAFVELWTNAKDYRFGYTTNPDNSNPYLIDNTDFTKTYLVNTENGWFKTETVLYSTGLPIGGLVPLFGPNNADALSPDWNSTPPYYYAVNEGDPENAEVLTTECPTYEIAPTFYATEPELVDGIIVSDSIYFVLPGDFSAVQIFNAQV